MNHQSNQSLFSSTFYLPCSTSRLLYKLALSILFDSLPISTSLCLTPFYPLFLSSILSLTFHRFHFLTLSRLGPRHPAYGRIRPHIGLCNPHTSRVSHIQATGPIFRVPRPAFEPGELPLGHGACTFRVTRPALERGKLHLGYEVRIQPTRAVLSVREPHLACTSCIQRTRAAFRLLQPSHATFQYRTTIYQQCHTSGYSKITRK